MPITDYHTLKAAIGDHMARADLADAADDFIRFATDYFNDGGDPLTDPPLRCREMEAVAELTPADGVCTLPDDYLQYRRVVEKAAPRRKLAYITPGEAEILHPGRAAGPACSFTIIGAGLHTFPAASNTIELTYYRRIENLSEAAPSNWLLAKSPQTYLRAALMFAAAYVKDDAELARQATLLRQLAAGLAGSDMLANYAGAGLQARGGTP